LQREGRTNEINTHDWLGIRKALTTYRAVHGGQAMKDTPISKYIREKRGLPDNWRVYLFEAVSDWKKIRLTGSLVRPVDPAFEPHLHRDFDWIKPLQGKATMTITSDEYGRIYDEAKQ